MTLVDALQWLGAIIGVAVLYLKLSGQSKAIKIEQEKTESRREEQYVEFVNQQREENKELVTKYDKQQTEISGLMTKLLDLRGVLADRNKELAEIPVLRERVSHQDEKIKDLEVQTENLKTENRQLRQDLHAATIKLHEIKMERDVSIAELKGARFVLESLRPVLEGGKDGSSSTSSNKASSEESAR